MKKKETWKKIAIVAACIFLNLLGKMIAETCRLPVWLDMVGTCIAAYFTGPVGGMIAGISNNLLFGLVNKISFAYAIISLFAALAVSLFVRKGYFESLSKAMVSSFWLGVMCLFASTPINLWLQDGYSGNMWGDALFDMLDWNGVPKILCAFAGEGIVEIVDKQICILLAYCLIHLLTKNGKRRGRADSLMVAVALIIPLALPVMEVRADINDSSVSDNFIPQIYNNSTGMMSSEANVIRETADGYIWIGSYAGLTKYDGTDFEFIRDSNITSVTCMMTDSRGRLWIGTNDCGIARYENGRFTYFKTEDGLPVNSIRTFAENEDGIVYVGTTDKICKINSDDQIQVIPQNLSYVISMESFGGLIAGVDNNGRLFALEKDDALAEVSEDLAALFCNCVKLTSKGLLLGSSDRRILVLEISGGQLQLAGQLDSSVEDVIDIEEDTSGRIWVCAESGIGFFNQEGEFQEQRYENFDSSLEGIHEDYQGNIWVASSRYGVLKLSKSRFVDLFAKANAENAVVNAVVSYNHDFYCGTDNGLVILSQEGYQQKENELTDLLQENRIRCLLVDSKNRLWICTYGTYGLLCYNAEEGGKIETYTMQSRQMTSDRIRCVMELSDGTIAVGTADGINFIKGDQVIWTVGVEDGLANSQILSLAEGEDGVVYAGTDGGGLYMLSDGKVIGRITTQEGLSSDVILRIVPYRQGFFVVTSNSLCYMDEEIRILEKFPYYNNYDIIISGEQAYVLSSAGIYVVDAQELCSGREIEFQLYSASDGLLSGITANAWNYMDEHGTLYICCNSGVVGFCETKDAGRVECKYGITSVICDGEEVPVTEDTYHIPGNAKHITISASVRNYALSDFRTCFYIEDVDNNSKLYSFDGIDSMQISNLPSGRYRMHLQLFGADGEELLQETTYILDKEQQTYEHTWYQIYLFVVCVEIIASATWSVILLLESNRRKEELEKLRKELEDKVLEQTEEIRLQQKRIEELFMQTVAALSDAVDAKDRYTSGHSKRVAKYAKEMAARMGKSAEDQEEVYRAGLLHDIGKIRIPEEIINKNGKLTKDEFELIKVHPVIGYRILKGISGNKVIAQGAKFHHERYDGQGYPNGLQGKNIPEIARILGVADSYDAMTSNRSYRKTLPQEAARAEIEKGKGTQFDPEIADIMLAMIQEDKAYEMKQEEDIQCTILVVDDESMDIEMIEFIMEDEPMYTIIGAPSGNRALEILAETKVDLILLDVRMPEMDGFETMARIREVSSVPIIFMTADKDFETIQKALEQEADDYITKPFLPLTLKEIIHSMLH